jgi:hypothetical protein
MLIVILSKINIPTKLKEKKMSEVKGGKRGLGVETANKIFEKSPYLLVKENGIIHVKNNEDKLFHSNISVTDACIWIVESLLIGEK